MHIDSRDSLPPKKLNRYFTLTERHVIQQRGIDLNSLPTAFDSNSAPVIQLSSQKIEAEQKQKEEEEKAERSRNDVFNKDDFDEVWILDDIKNNEENDSTETKEEQQLQNQQDIIAKNSQIISGSRNFRGAAFSPANNWRSFFFVYNRLVGEGFGYTLAVRIKLLNNIF